MTLPPPAAAPRALQPLTWLVAATVALVLLLAVGTQRLVREEFDSAEAAARAAAQAAADTYQSHLLRTLHEVDQATRLLAWAAEQPGPPGQAIERLRQRGLLPPEQFFVLRLLRDDGHRPRLSGPDGVQLEAAAGGVPGLVFSRPLAGGLRAVVELDSAFLMAGYDSTRLGRDGVLAVVDMQGRTLAQRDGDRLLAAGLPLALRPGLMRAAPVYDWPLVVAAGVSADEQLAPTRARARGYVLGATAGAVLTLALALLLGRQHLRLAAEQRDHAQRIEQMALHDALTGLPNRHALDLLLDHHGERSRRHGDRLSLMFLDLDGFKAVNDGHGHEAGDELLRQVATRLKACVRASDVVARVGGDEFVVLVVQPGGEERTRALARRIVADVARPYRIGQAECRVTTSIGIATHRAGAVDVADMMRRADAAMYRAKTRGKNGVAYGEAA